MLVYSGNQLLWRAGASSYTIDAEYIESSDRTAFVLRVPDGRQFVLEEFDIETVNFSNFVPLVTGILSGNDVVPLTNSDHEYIVHIVGMRAHDVDPEENLRSLIENITPPSRRTEMPEGYPLRRSRRIELDSPTTPRTMSRSSYGSEDSDPHLLRNMVAENENRFVGGSSIASSRSRRRRERRTSHASSIALSTPEMNPQSNWDISGISPDIQNVISRRNILDEFNEESPIPEDVDVGFNDYASDASGGFPEIINDVLGGFPEIAPSLVRQNGNIPGRVEISETNEEKLFRIIDEWKKTDDEDVILDLSGMELETLDDSIIPENVRRLNLNNNRLTKVPKLRGLDELWIENNLLDNVDLNKYKYLRVFWYAGNPFYNRDLKCSNPNDLFLTDDILESGNLIVIIQLVNEGRDFIANCYTLEELRESFSKQPMWLWAQHPDRLWFVDKNGNRTPSYMGGNGRPLKWFPTRKLPYEGSWIETLSAHMLFMFNTFVVRDLATFQIGTEYSSSSMHGVPEMLKFLNPISRSEYINLAKTHVRGTPISLNYDFKSKVNDIFSSENIGFNFESDDRDGMKTLSLHKGDMLLQYMYDQQIDKAHPIGFRNKAMVKLSSLDEKEHVSILVDDTVTGPPENPDYNVRHHFSFENDMYTVSALDFQAKPKLQLSHLTGNAKFELRHNEDASILGISFNNEEKGYVGEQFLMLQTPRYRFGISTNNFERGIVVNEN
jgi:hypothetical protein